MGLFIKEFESVQKEKLLWINDLICEDKYYDKHRTFWNTLGKNFLYNISTGVGCDTGLISENALKTGNVTDEHVYSNVKMFNRLFELYKEGKVDLEYLKENVQHIVPTIKTTPEEAMKPQNTVKVFKALYDKDEHVCMYIYRRIYIIN